MSDLIIEEKHIFLKKEEAACGLEKNSFASDSQGPV